MEALSNSKCFKVHVTCFCTYAFVAGWPVLWRRSMQPMRMFNAVPRPAMRGSLLLHRAVGPATQERQLLLHMHACHAHENKTRFSVVGGTANKNPRQNQSGPSGLKPLSMIVIHSDSVLFFLIHSDSYSLFSMFFVSNVLILSVCLIVRLWRPLYIFTKVHVLFSRAISWAGTLSTTAPQSHHDRKRDENQSALENTQVTQTNDLKGHSLEPRIYNWSLSWAQVYERLDALCWGCRRAIHTLILQALNHLLKALRRQ